MTFRFSSTFLFKTAIVSGVAIFATFLLNHHIFFTPELSYAYRPGQTPKIVVPDNPSTVVQTADKSARWRLTSDAFPFNVTFPRLVPSVHITAKLRNINQPLVMFLAKGNEKVGDMQTVVHADVLEKLDWGKVSADGLTLWMRDQRIIEDKKTSIVGGNKVEGKKTETLPVRQYTTVPEFLSDPPQAARVASSGLNPMLLTKVTDYQSRLGSLTITSALRGSHRIFLYAANEDIRVSFDVQDLNWAAGPDNVVVKLGRVDQINDRHSTWMTTHTLRDDGMLEPTKKRSSLRFVEVTLPAATPGVYVLDIQTTHDILIKNLTTSQQRFAFSKHLYVADGPIYGAGQVFSSIPVVTNGTYVKLAPNHEPGKQDVRINGKTHRLSTLRFDTHIDLPDPETSFSIDKGDIVVTTDGLITIKPADLIDGRGMQPLDLSGTPNLEGVDYVLAAYVPHGDQPDLAVNESYDLNELLYVKNNLRFVFNAPGLRALDGQLGLEEIRATFQRGPFPWDKVWKKLKLRP